MLSLRFRRAAVASAAALFMATAAVALPGAASAAQTAPAAPAATGALCWGPSCIGKDPLWNGNSQRDCVKGIANPYQGGYADAAYDVVTIDTDGVGSLTLRYSPLCAANWARYTGSNGYLEYWVETADYNKSGTQQGNLTPKYTTMVDGNLLARVCFYHAGTQIGGCSGWY